MKKILIILAALLLCTGALSAKTVLYSETAGEGIFEKWTANTGRKWLVSAKIDEEDGKYVAWSNVRDNGTNNGLKEPLALTYAVDIDPAKYTEATLVFVYAQCPSMNEKDISTLGLLEVLISCDGGKSYKKTSSLASCEIDGRIMKSDALSIIFNCKSGDIIGDTRGVITNVMLRPYGDGGPTGGLFRILKVEVVGYNGDYKAPELKTAEPEYEKDVNTDDIRKIAVDEMLRMGTVKWTPKTTYYTYGTHHKWTAGQQYVGIPYTSKYYFGTYDEFAAEIDAGGVYNGPTDEKIAVGTYCSSSVNAAWALVTDLFFGTTIDMVKTYPGNGLVLLGNLKWSENSTEDTGDIVEINSQSDYFKALAELRPGDVVISTDYPSHHVRMLTGGLTVVMDGSGNINGLKSYGEFSENGGGNGNSTWNINKKYTFYDLFNKSYMPFSCEAFASGRVASPVINVYGMPTGESLAKQGLSGIIKSNYRIKSFEITVTDMHGDVVWSKASYGNTKYYYLFDDSETSAKLTALGDGIYRITVSIETGPLTSLSDSFNVYTPVDIKYYKGEKFERFRTTLQSLVCTLPTLRTASSDRSACSELLCASDVGNVLDTVFVPAAESLG